MKIFKIAIAIVLSVATFIPTLYAEAKFVCPSANYAPEYTSAELDIPAKSAYLVEAGTGTVLFSKNETESCYIASVTKVMTLLLVMEAIENGTINLIDTVMVSKKAASMGGSQVFLEEGESITIEELIKCAVIASANDASVALAEAVSGSEGAFIAKMNEKAGQLSLANSYFENTTGLDDTTVNHHSCARDIAQISRELIKYPLILKYSSTWQDSIRNGEMVLTNTNRLIRYYEGCNGLKTGSTDKAGFCITVSAKRQNMQLIAVVLGADTKDERNAAARKMLDYGFANFALFESPESYLEKARVRGGRSDFTDLYKSAFSTVVPKSKAGSIEETYEIPEYLTAPFDDGAVVGKITYKLDGEVLGSADIYTSLGVEKIGGFELFWRILRKIIAGM